MRKVLFVLLLTIVSIGASAQMGAMSGHAKAGFAFDPTRFGVGGEFRYGITENIRGAGDAIVFFPKDKVWGLDFNINAHYVFDVADGLDIYPLAGLNISNARIGSQTIDLGFGQSYKTKSVGTTNFGFNIGCGLDYALSEKNYLNTEFKYTFGDGDFATLMFGYGFRF